MQASKHRHSKELRHEMRMIGPFWLAPWRLAVLCGRKTRTFLEQGLPHGLQIGWGCTWLVDEAYPWPTPLFAKPMTYKRQSLSWHASKVGRGTPSMRTVQRFASAVGARAVVRMEPLTAA